MADIKVACWNIYFAHKLVEMEDGKLRITPKEKTRADTIADIITKMDPAVLGVVECMSPKEFTFFRRTFFPHMKSTIEGDKSRLNIGMLYDPTKVKVRKLSFDKGGWKARIGYKARQSTYRFSRTPLICSIEDLATGKSFACATVHMKSKKTYTEDKAEPFENRKKIVAQALRTREIMAKIAATKPEFERFIVMGDVNDGPMFDEYEAKIVVSGVESLIGSVFFPDDVYFSINDLSKGGIPTTPFKGAPQLDHLLYSRGLAGSGKPQIKAGTDQVRTDLVDFSKGSGKKKDSDHAPVEVVVSC